VTKDSSLLNHVYYGTPFSGYRQKIVREMKESGLSASLLAPEYFLDLTGQKAKLGNLKGFMDLDSGANSVQPAEFLKTGQSLHSLLRALVQDFYREPSTTDLFSEVYPARFFNLLSSANCVHQLMHRLRNYFLRAHLPVQILERDGLFRLEGGLSIRMTRASGVVENPETKLLVERLKLFFLMSEFSASQAARHLKVSHRSMNRALAEAVKEGHVSKSGHARMTRFCVKI